MGVSLRYIVRRVVRWEHASHPLRSPPASGGGMHLLTQRVPITQGSAVNMARAPLDIRLSWKPRPVLDEHVLYGDVLERSVTRGTPAFKGWSGKTVCRSGISPYSLERPPQSLERWSLSLIRSPCSLERWSLSLIRSPLSLIRSPSSLERPPLSLKRSPLSLKDRLFH